MAKSYKMRKFENGRNKQNKPFINYSLTLPTPLAEKLIEQMGDDIEFEIDLTEDGILYKPREAQEDLPETLPFAKGKAAPAKAKSAAKAAAKPKAASKSAPAAKSTKTATKSTPGKNLAGKKAAAAPKAKPAAPKAGPKSPARKPAAPRAPKARPAKVAA